MKISDKTRFILLNVGAAILLFIIIGIVVLGSLDNYTKHGHSISVPAFYGLTPDEAEDAARRENLRVQIIDSLYDEEAKPGTIVEQYPAGGAEVKDNRMVHLTINARNPEKVSFPNLQNSAYRQTLQTLALRGFRIGSIEYAPSEFKNLVLELKHNGSHVVPGTMLQKGAAITIVLGAGEEGNTTAVPLLVGKKLSEALPAALQSYLNIDQVIPDATIKTKEDKAAAVVYRQSLSPNSIVSAGSGMTLHITLQKNKIPDLDSLVVTE